jgi:hypothetical protein
MKKLLMIVATAALTLSFVGCENSRYKQMGEEYANRLQKLCELQDTAAVVALDDSIRMVQDELTSKGDTANLRVFNAAFSEVRKQYAPFITVSKMGKGTPKEEAVQDVVEDAMTGQGDIETVTKSIGAALEKEGKPQEVTRGRRQQ